jgi:fibronectin type 3 domain-containing protein
VNVTWNSSTNAVGYNVYRSTVSGGPYAMVNSSLDGATAYSDTAVDSGQTYYYVATAVDDNSNESSYSMETQAVVPNP